MTPDIGGGQPQPMTSMAEASRRRAVVLRAFQQRHLQASREWVDACVAWCGCVDGAFGDNGGRPPSDAALVEACLTQWLHSDLRVEGAQEPRCRFPLNEMRTALKANVPEGFYTVMVLAAYDVGSAAYGQLQKAEKASAKNEPAAEEQSQHSTQASWEPKGGRMLKLVLTNGDQTVEALEDQPIPQLVDPVPPGLKLTLTGPMECRRGILLLGHNSVRVHGGSVDDLAASHASSVVLESRLKGHLAPDGVEQPRPPVADEPTQTFQPKGLPTKYKAGVAPPLAPLPSIAQRRQPPREESVWLGSVATADYSNQHSFHSETTSESGTSTRGQRGRGRRARAATRQPRAGRGSSRGGAARNPSKRARGDPTGGGRRTSRGGRRGRGSRAPLATVTNDVFDEDDDALLASVDVDVAAVAAASPGIGRRYGQRGDVFDDGDDDLFLMIDA